MRVHKLNNVEQAMDLLEKHKVYLVYGEVWEEGRRGMNKERAAVLQLNLRYHI